MTVWMGSLNSLIFKFIRIFFLVFFSLLYFVPLYFPIFSTHDSVVLFHLCLLIPSNQKKKNIVVVNTCSSKQKQKLYNSITVNIIHYFELTTDILPVLLLLTVHDCWKGSNKESNTWYLKAQLKRYVLDVKYFLLLIKTLKC